ncbi:hypothetical protein MPH_07522, partial [Macrophomina phaseolina MS6]
IISLTRITY